MKKLAVVALAAMVALSGAAAKLNLDWKLGKNARIKNNLLIVSVERNDKNQGTEMANASIDLAPFSGKMVEIKAKCFGFNVTKAKLNHHGFKFMLHFRDAETGQRHWPQAGVVTGTFGEQEVRVRAYVTPEKVDEGRLSFGLQFGAGTVVLDLATLEMNTIELKDGEGYRVKYPEAVKNMPKMRGVMSPGNKVKEDDMRTLKEWGATLLRYQICRGWGNRWANRDIPEYYKWIDERMDHLEEILGWAKKYGLKVVVDLHTPAGGRTEAQEHTLFFDKKYEECFYEVWRRIATRFKGRKEIYGFDLINEPVQHNPGNVDYLKLQENAAKIVRGIDPDTPIIIEANEWDAPQAFWYLKPLKMDNVIYQVHMYLPGGFTHQLSEPKDKPAKWQKWPDASKGWTKEAMRKDLKPVLEFQRKTGCRIYVGEFSAVAWAPGADEYLKECINLFEEYGWDWSYHAFREYQGWSVEHEGTGPRDLKPSADNARMRVLKEGFKRVD